MSYEPTNPEAALAALENRTPRPVRPLAQLYRVENPHTGAVEFLEKSGRLYSWAVYCRNLNGRTIHIDWSNADTEAAAIAEVSRFNLTCTDYAAAEAHTTTPGQRDGYLARRARLAPGDAERAKWAHTLTEAALDYLRSGADEHDTRIAKEHLGDMVGQAMHFMGAKHMPPGWYTEHERRLVVRAEAAARHFIIVERDLDNHGRPEAIEHRLTQYLTRRDALVRELEAIAPI